VTKDDSQTIKETFEYNTNAPITKHCIVAQLLMYFKSRIMSA